MQESPPFLSAALVARPPRVVVLVELSEQIPWQLSYLDALHTQAEVWGGSQNILLPLPRLPNTASGLFAELVDRFDPDMVAVHRGTNGSLRWLAPSAYQDRLDRFSQENDPVQMVDDWKQSPLDNYEPLADELKELLTRRFAVISPFDGEPFGPSLRSALVPPWPLTEIGALSGCPQNVRVYRTDFSDTWHLLLAAVFGDLSPGSEERLSSVITVERIVESDAQGCLELLEGGLGNENARPPTAWEASETGLKRLGVPYWQQQPEGPMIVAGSDPMDFSLFYALHRWTGRAVWVPTELDLDDHQVRTLALSVDSMTEPGEAVTITSSEPTVAAMLGDRLPDLLSWRAPKVVDPVETLPERPAQLFMDGYSEKATTVLLRNDQTVPLDTPIPSSQSNQPANKIRWMTQVWADGWTPVRHGGLGRHLLSAPGGDYLYARASGDGVAYFCPHHSTFSTSLDEATIRPRLNRMPLLDQASRILGGFGWQVRVSDKGIYARESAALAGGWRELCALLRDPDISRLLGAFRDGTAGTKLSADGGRSYLSLQDLKEAVGNDQAPEAIDRVGDFVERGLILKCSRCRQASWFALGSFSTVFGCRRCGLEQRVTWDRWLGESDPIWFYRPAEVLYQLLEHDGQLPLFTMDRLVGTSREPIDLTHEVEIVNAQSDQFEVDFLLSIGSRLILGEATQRDSFGTAAEENRRFQRLHQLADLTGAASIVLATSAESFRQPTLGRAKSTFGLHLEAMAQLA